jgi:hypothetical protein
VGNELDIHWELTEECQLWFIRVLIFVALPCSEETIFKNVVRRGCAWSVKLHSPNG